MRDFTESLLPGVLKYYILNSQKASQLFLSCQTTWIQKKSNYYFYRGQTTCLTASIHSHWALNNIKQHNTCYSFWLIAQWL